MIPAPSTESVELRVGDEYIIMGTDSLWKFVTYEQIIHDVRSIADPIRASKRLRDLAVSHGCAADVSVIVVKLNIDRGPPAHSVLELEKLTRVDDHDSSSEDDDEEIGVTNIDDILSDSEGEDVVDTQGKPATGYTGDLDQLILGAIQAPPSVNTPPTVHSTNFDELTLTDNSSGNSTPTAADLKSQDFSNLARQHKEMVSRLEEISDVAQTLPKHASKSRKSRQGSRIETNFETTQVSKFFHHI